VKYPGLKALHVLFAFLFSVTILFAQRNVEPGGFRHITVRDGLPSSEVYKIIQDRLGYMWMCTDAGVCRYNGYNFQSFTTRNGLTDNTVFRLKEDKNGEIWAQGFSGALSYFDGTRFNPIGANDSLVALYSNGQKNSFCMETDTSGGLLVGGLFTKGCFRIGPEDNFAVPHMIRPVGIPDSFLIIWSLTNKKGHAYVGMPVNATGGLFFNNGVNTTVNFTSLKLKGIPSNNLAYQMHDGRLIFTFHNILYCIDASGNFEVHTFPAPIISADEDLEGNVWISTFFGGTYLCPNGNFNNPRRLYLEGKTVSCVFEDTEKGYWFTTVGDGVYYLPDIRFGYLTPSEGLSEPSVQSLAPFRKHEMVIGLPNGSIALYNPDAEPDKRLITGSSKEKITLPIEAIVTRNDSILASANGVWYLDSALRFGQNLIKGGHFKGVISNPENNCLMFFSPVKLCWLKSGFPADSSQITKIRFTAACYASDGTLWLGALNGLWKFIGNRPVYMGDSTNGIKARVDGICQDKNGFLWLATRGEGIFAIRGDKKFHYGEEDGMAANTCRAITIDKNGAIWVGTNHGITIVTGFNPENGNAKLRSFNTSHGLLSDEVKFIQCFDDKIWMGSNEGVCWIPVQALVSDSVPPPVYITHVLFGSDSCKLNEASTFDFSDKTIRIFVEGLCFRDPTGIRYKYRMLGGDEHWITTANREISFSGLTPGDYSLEIIAVNSDGVESNHPSVFSFHILAPFYRTWWFLLLLVFILISLVWLGANFRSRIKQRRENEKAETERRIAELRLSALRAQMNPHFIFNAINSIQHFVLQNDSEQAYNYLAKFSRLIRLVLDQSQSETIPLGQELKMLNLYIELEQLRFERPFTYEIEVDPDLIEENIKVPGMLIQPFVENAIWHGLLPKKTGDAKIRISILKSGPVIEILIEDNGVGRNSENAVKKEDEKHRSYGLQITEERLRLADQKSPDQPVIHITDLKDENGSPAGTRVIIHLASEDDD
jgi:ligand-binding sensor domain-containing protein